MTDRPRILLVKPVLPYPPDQGTRIVSFDLIRSLSRWYDVTVLARLLDPGEEVHARELEKYCSRVVTVMAPSRRNLLTRAAYRIGYLIRSFITRRSLKSLYDCPGAFVRRARELSLEPFDLVIVEYWQLYPLLDVFAAAHPVLFTHDIELLVNRQAALLERGLFRKIRLVRRWLSEQREEVGAYRRARRVLALTERDAAAVRKLTHQRTEASVLPVAVDPQPAGEPVARNADEVLFMGAMGAWFNRDALVYFMRHIVPQLDGVRVRVTIVGGDLPREVASFSRWPGVEVVGRVADVTPFLSRATCIAIPMRFGGGLRVRILEAMVAGLPVVCTGVAMAGMDFEPERHYLLADEPVAFAGQIERLLGDPELAVSMAAAARDRVLSLYGREAQQERLQALVQHLLNQ